MFSHIYIDTEKEEPVCSCLVLYIRPTYILMKAVQTHLKTLPNKRRSLVDLLCVLLLRSLCIMLNVFYCIINEIKSGLVYYIEYI